MSARVAYIRRAAHQRAGRALTETGKVLIGLAIAVGAACILYWMLSLDNAGAQTPGTASSPSTATAAGPTDAAAHDERLRRKNELE